MLTLALWLALGALPAAAEPTTVTLIATGATGGIGSSAVRLDVPFFVTRSIGASATSVEAIHGVAARGPFTAVADDGRVETLARAWDQPIICEATTEALRFDRDDRLALSGPIYPRPDGSIAWTQRQCTTLNGATYTLYGPQDAPLPERLTGFELRRGMVAQFGEGALTTTATIVGVPRDEGTRRVGVITRLRSQNPDAVLVDAGNFLDGASAIVDSALSLHRPALLAALRELSPDGLCPGRNELLLGLDYLLAEAGDLPWLITNSDLEQPRVPKWRTVTRGDTRIAILCAIDPALTSGSPALAAEKLALSSPGDAVNAAVVSLVTSDEPPDLTVLLVSGTAAMRANLARGGLPVDVIVGDDTWAGQRARQLEVQVDPNSQRGPGVVVPLGEPALVSLDLDGGLVGARIARSAVEPSSPPARALLGSVTDVRLRSYPAVDKPLIPAPPGNPTGRWRTADWHKLICEGALEHTGAHVALLAELPPPPDVPGPLSNLFALDGLAMLDELIVLDLPGDALTRLLLRGYANVPVACGAPLGERAPLVDGYPVDALRTYRVLTTTRTEADPIIGPLLRDGRSVRLLDQPTRRALRTDENRPLTLRAAAISGMSSVRQAHGESAVAALATRKPTDKEPQWFARVERLSLRATQFTGANDPTYASVPETLATSPSSLTLAGDLDAAIVYRSRRFGFEVRTRDTFARQATGDVITEPADDARISTAVSLPGVQIKVGPGFSPYLESLLDSEFTAIVPVDGDPLPQQADLLLTLGVSATPKAWLTRLRVGGFALRDLSRLERPVEPGARLEMGTRHALGRDLALVTSLDGFVYGKTAFDDATRLRFKVLGDARVELPLARSLAISGFGQAFVFRGRVPETSNTRVSTTVGASIDVSGATRLVANKKTRQ